MNSAVSHVEMFRYAQHDMGGALKSHGHAERSEASLWRAMWCSLRCFAEFTLSLSKGSTWH